jgi:hypothetical protein
MLPAAPPLRCCVLSLPKHGNTADEYEDAWSADTAKGRFAVADGASESAFAGLWARLLTEGFVSARGPLDLANWLEVPRRQWWSELIGLDLPWYAEMKREQGAYATLLGVSIRRATANRQRHWRAVAVGDSCFVRVRKNRHAGMFPLKHSSEFGNQPTLIGSRQEEIPTCQRCSGSLRPGDRLFLMTDALAQWFLSRQENGERAWEAVRRVLSASQPEVAFAAWIEELRVQGALRNDDVTLLSVEVGPEHQE